MNFNNFAKDILSALPTMAQPLSSSTSSSFRSDFLNTTIYVADLPLTVTYKDLVEVFENKVGPCEVVIKRHLFKNFHFAYVSFKDASLGMFIIHFNYLLLAKKAAEVLRYPIIQGAECRILPYSLKHAKIQSRNANSGDADHSSAATTSSDIFVKGFIKSQWMHSDLHRAFEKFGTILSAKVSLDRNHKTKGYGYVQFENPE